MKRGREGRVHEDDAGTHRVGQIVVNLLGVEARDGRARKQQPEEIGAGAGDLVERQVCAVQLGEDGELARAGGRLEHEVGGRHARGERRR